MKKIILFSILSLILSACSTMQPFKPEDSTSEGIRYKYGASKGLKIGDKVTAYKKVPSAARSGYSYEPAGTLTVSRVESDYSIIKKDSEFEINADTAFLKE
ncbi:MAG: hypothetical protein J0L82_00915 [Deltaproteobacteria bacterium]|nr:hypothetical protein [Deltaproteobacteria bacterium]